MRKILLMLGIVICFVNGSLAETWNCGPATDGIYSDSVKCTYDEATKTLTISGEGEMGNYPNVRVNGKDGSTAPWFGKDIVHAVVEVNVTSIGDRVFKGAENLTDIVGLENITRVGDAAFLSAKKLTSIDLPNVQEIGGVAFLNTSSLQYLGIPTEAVVYLSDTCSRTPNPCSSYANRDTFHGSKLSNCRKTGDCGNCGEKFVQAGVGCVSSCYTGYTSYYGFCTRTRYTLPEADAATSDDNENMIEWIFE
ncbi:MAG: leucine-rich repeat protein [Alphaproteobacteria bacterium]|nr:leucine-rich repeat protein [Alphaproteobacteria bacterium]